MCVHDDGHDQLPNWLFGFFDPDLLEAATARQSANKRPSPRTKSTPVLSDAGADSRIELAIASDFAPDSSRRQLVVAFGPLVVSSA